jgi:1-propanol dehydrogenase
VVITDTKERRKMELASKELVADVVILDPQLPLTMPKSLVADTGVDALANALEAYVSQWHNYFSDLPGRERRASRF